MLIYVGYYGVKLCLLLQCYVIIGVTVLSYGGHNSAELCWMLQC